MRHQQTASNKKSSNRYSSQASAKQRSGFATMDPGEQRQISSMGGRATHEERGRSKEADENDYGSKPRNTRPYGNSSSCYGSGSGIGYNNTSSSSPYRSSSHDDDDQEGVDQDENDNYSSQHDSSRYGEKHEDEDNHYASSSRPSLYDEDDNHEGSHEGSDDEDTLNDHSHERGMRGGQSWDNQRDNSAMSGRRNYEGRDNRQQHDHDTDNGKKHSVYNTSAANKNGRSASSPSRTRNSAKSGRRGGSAFH